VNPFLLAVLAYLLGATPTSFWVGKGIYGVDLRREGSGNLGATNALRVLGWKAAVPVVAVDMLKGWFPVWLFPRVDMPGTPDAWVLLYGAAAILGHVFSVWVAFRGGKGVATGAGVFLALTPLAVLVAFVVWLVVVVLTRIVSLASILAALSLPVAVVLTPHAGGRALEAFTAALALFVVWAHRSNIGRLLRGEELRFGRDGTAAAPEGPPEEPGGAEPGSGPGGVA